MAFVGKWVIPLVGQQGDIIIKELTYLRTGYLNISGM